uniref:START domain-containing protein n=1 Tax=Angiostrongylus cantonensis TaxID=6313 RepID=A0A0K0DED2_ANGCA
MGDEIQYLMCAEDNEKAINDARRHLQWFLNPCSNDDSIHTYLEEKSITCNDSEIDSITGSEYVQRYCNTTEVHEKVFYFVLKKPDNSELFVDASCLDPYYVWETDGDKRWEIAHASGVMCRAAVCSKLF